MSQDGIKCRCGKINRTGIKYCTECGALLEVDNNSALKNTAQSPQDDSVICPNCNKQIRSGIRFCTGCGFDLSKSTMPTEESESNIVNEPNKSAVFVDKSLEDSKTTHEQTIICSNCGASNDIELNFCKKCGSRLKEAGEELNTQPVKKKRKTWLWILIIIALVAILAVGGIAYLYYTNNSILDEYFGSSFGNQAVERTDEEKNTESKQDKTKQSEKEVEDTVEKKDDEESTPISEIDIFKDIDLSFAGKNGEGIAELSINRNYQGISFAIDKSEGLHNEDIIEVSIKYDTNQSDFENKNGVRPISEKKEYIVSGLEEIDENLVEIKVPVSSIDSSSYLKVKSKDNSTYAPENTLDGNMRTAWVEGVSGDGVNESITYRFDDEYDISKIVVYNGFLKTKYRYTINGKPTKVQIIFENGEAIEKELEVIHPGEADVEFSTDELTPTVITLDSPIRTNRVTIKIRGVETGTKYEDTAISEVEIYGLVDKERAEELDKVSSQTWASGLWMNIVTDPVEAYSTQYELKLHDDGSADLTGFRNQDHGSFTYTGEKEIEVHFSECYFYSAEGKNERIEGYEYTVKGVKKEDSGIDYLYLDFDKTFEQSGYSNAHDDNYYRM